MTHAVPQGYHSITPSLNIEGVEKAIALYKKAFGATQNGEAMVCPQTGKIMHVELTIGDSKIMLADVMPNCPMGATHSAFCVYLPDADAAFKTATQAGLTSLMEPEDMFWGDRMGTVQDPFGNCWSLATRVKNLSDPEIKEAAQAWAQKQQPKAA